MDADTPVLRGVAEEVIRQPGIPPRPQQRDPLAQRHRCPARVAGELVAGATRHVGAAARAIERHCRRDYRGHAPRRACRWLRVRGIRRHHGLLVHARPAFLAGATDRCTSSRRAWCSRRRGASPPGIEPAARDRQHPDPGVSSGGRELSDGVHAVAVKARGSKDPSHRCWTARDDSTVRDSWGVPVPGAVRRLAGPASHPFHAFSRPG